MTTREIPTDDPLEMIRAIREKQYEETKDMTIEEQREYTRKKCVAFYERSGMLDKLPASMLRPQAEAS